jgi:hypothetical protein
VLTETFTGFKQKAVNNIATQLWWRQAVNKVLLFKKGQCVVDVLGVCRTLL